MGSDGNQNPWQTYDTYKDCSQGICSIYCPQWCYIIFPPPPPFTLGDDEDGGSGSDFSPLIIAVIGIVASACILISYYTIISKYCRRRRGHGGDSIEGDEHHQHTNESWQGSNTNTAAAGLDESVIKSITVCIYKKGDGFVDGTDCSVCLTEFQENESLRLLPKCSHAFHLPCIDTWLKSHATCPLCRANIASAPTQQPAPPENQETPASTTNAASVTYVTAQQYQQHRSNDSVLVIQDLERFVQEEAVVNLVHEVDDHHHFNLPKPAVQDLELSESMIGIREDNVNGVQPIRRSVSLNSSMCHNRMSIADILRINEDDRDETRDIEKNKLEILNLVRSPLAMKRSISTGRFMFMTRYENGRSSVILN